MYETLFPDINYEKLLTVNKNGNNIIVDESYFTEFMIIDRSNKNPDFPIEIVGVGNIIVYCDFKKNVGFFIWKNVIKEEEEEEDDGQPRSRLFPAIAIGSLVTTGAVIGTLFGLGIIGGKTKKKRILRKGIKRIKVKTNRKSRKSRKNKKNKN
jgi:hypothetical protein